MKIIANQPILPPAPLTSSLPHHPSQGDEGDKFYIIKEGEVKCTKGGSEVSRRLTKGDFFGELALLSSDKRAATVTVTKPGTSVLTLSRAEFGRLFGTLADLMKEAGASTHTA